jgi:hypothetical protein
MMEIPMNDLLISLLGVAVLDAAKAFADRLEGLRQRTQDIARKG